MNVASPINPAVLKWARETAGHSIEDVVLKLKRKRITVDIVSAWEDGRETPDYSMLERLAYEVYKRPIAVFFFPQPPEEETPRQAFRTLPDSEIDMLPPRILFLLRQAEAMQSNLAELFDGNNPAERHIVRDVHFRPNSSVDALALSVREYLGIELSEQLQWKSSELAFKSWRNALEERGVFVFKDAFREDSFSGFCIRHETYPLIYVNNSRPFTHQVFTLFHELAHLLSGTGGIDLRNKEYIRTMEGTNKETEVLCNAFASAFLVPTNDFDRTMARIRITEVNLNDLAARYSVSREVILRRLRDKGVISPEYYEETVNEWANGGKGTPGSGGNYYFSKGSYLGERYMELVFGRLYQNRISIDQAADYLGVKVRSIPRMEALLFPKGSAA